jgi:hypothetical protein
MQTEQVRVRISKENAGVLKRWADDSGLQQIEIATMLLHAAVLAVRDSKGKVCFPVRFEVADGPGAAADELPARRKT